MPKFELPKNESEKDSVERLDDNWKLHEKEIREHFAKKQATIDDLLNKLNSLDLNKEISIFHVFEEAKYDNDAEIGTSEKGISTIYRVSELIRLLTEEKDLIQVDKIKSYVYKYASPDDPESVVRVATGRADFETHNEQDILTFDEIEETLKEQK